jgi:hypothetical protein
MNMNTDKPVPPDEPRIWKRLVPDRTRDIPGLSIDAWRKKYADLMAPISFKPLWARKDEPDFAAIRKTGNLDGDEVGVMGQVQIVRDSGDLREIPVWMNNHTAVKEFLLAHFPHLVTNEKQKHAAAKWLFIIEHFRNKESARNIANKWNQSIMEMTGEELLDALFGDGIPVHRLDAAQVRSTIQKILHVAEGKRTDGKSKRRR